MNFEWVLNNWALVLTGLFALLALILTGRALAYWRWANEVVWFAFIEAEKEGLLNGWSGADKLRHYLQLWREHYVAKWGQEPSQDAISAAVAKAEKLAELHSAVRDSAPKAS